MDKRKRTKEQGMHKNGAIKIVRTNRKRKGGKSKGFNSQWVIYCTKCGSIITDKWDTDYYNCPCPECKNEGKEITMSKEKLLKNMAKDIDKLFCIKKRKRVLNSDEISLLTSFRETRFKSELDSLIHDFGYINNNNQRRIYFTHREGDALYFGIYDSQDIDILRNCPAEIVDSSTLRYNQPDYGYDLTITILDQDSFSVTGTIDDEYTTGIYYIASN